MDDDHFFSRHNSYEVNSRIMVTAIASLSFVVILVLILHLYARFKLRRQIQRQAAFPRLTTTNAPPPKTGLDPAVIASLPIFMFRQTTNYPCNNNNNDQTGSMECAVCLCVLEDGEMARSLPNCKHTFHADCVDKWLGSNSTCPICRTGAVPRLVAEPREGVAVSIGGTTLEEEGTTSDLSAKVSGSSSRLSSFRRMLSREGSSRRIHVQSQSGVQEEHGTLDLERQ